MSSTPPRPDPGGLPPEPGPTRYERALVSPEFVAHRRRFRRFVLPLSALFLAWYATYVLLADYAHEFMSRKVSGNITVGLLLGLGQFVSTFAITTAYVVWANRRFDPAAARLREHLEADALREQP